MTENNPEQADGTSDKSFGIFRHPAFKDLPWDAYNELNEMRNRAYEAGTKHRAPSPETMRLIQKIEASLEKHSVDNDGQFGRLDDQFRRLHETLENFKPSFELVRDLSTVCRYGKIIGAALIGIFIFVGTIAGGVLAIKRWILNQ